MTVSAAGFYYIHRPLTHRPNNHQPTDKTMLKRLENMKPFILENANTGGKMENYYQFA